MRELSPKHGVSESGKCLSLRLVSDAEPRHNDPVTQGNRDSPLYLPA